VYSTLEYNLRQKSEKELTQYDGLRGQDGHLFTTRLTRGFSAVSKKEAAMLISMHDVMVRIMNLYVSVLSVHYGIKRHLESCKLGATPRTRMREWRYSSTHSKYEGKSSVSRPGRFTPWKEPRYTSDRRLGGPWGQSVRGGEEKNSLPLLGIEPRSSIP
jgi:hypothetical protein